ncbi:MAG: hypothetical protein JWN98_2470, partial [Abditibacteriota bacterium]|nr:hypothetical protein [Abditibacteriota bacterium]
EDGPLRHKLQECDVETRVMELSSRVVGTRKDTLGVRSLLQVSTIFRMLAYCRRLARFCQTRDIDIVHTNSLKADLFGGVAAVLARRPVIWHVRDRIADDYLPSPVVIAFRWLCRILPTHVIAISNATLETLHLPSTQATVVHDGVIDHGHSHNRDSQNKSVQSGIVEAGALIGIIGRVTRWKGQHIFLQAAAQVQQQFPQTRFRIIGASLFGEEEYQAELERMVEELGLCDCVEFTGFVPDVLDHLQELDILVHASITSEPFGLVVAEGMMAAKPVVATKGGGVLEVVQDGVTGRLVPMGDADAMAEALKELLAKPEAAHAMGRAGQKRVQEHFTIELTVNRIQQLYDTVWQRWSSSRGS